MTEPKRGERSFIGFEIDEDQFEQLKRALDKQGITIEQWVKSVVQERIREHEQEAGKPQH